MTASSSVDPPWGSSKSIDDVDDIEHHEDDDMGVVYDSLCLQPSLVKAHVCHETGAKLPRRNSFCHEADTSPCHGRFSQRYRSNMLGSTAACMLDKVKQMNGTGEARLKKLVKKIADASGATTGTYAYGGSEVTKQVSNDASPRSPSSPPGLARAETGTITPAVSPVQGEVMEFFCFTLCKWIPSQVCEPCFNGSWNLELENQVPTFRLRPLTVKSAFVEGELVEYYSTTHEQWLATKVITVRPDGKYDLECKPQAEADRIRHPVPVLKANFNRGDSLLASALQAPSLPAEAELIESLLRERECSRNLDVNCPIVRSLAEHFEKLPPLGLRRARRVFDSGLIFSSSNRHIDLRVLVFKYMNANSRRRLLSRIRTCCKPIDQSVRGLVVLTDIDDTLMPGTDALGVAGTDRSGVNPGEMYPGVRRLCRELRADLRSGHDLSYPVLLSARPSWLVLPLVEKFMSLCSGDRALAILPGKGGSHVPMNLARILALGDYAALGRVKILRMVQYSLLFPDYAGRFCFIGDDGQADLQVADDMLSLRCADWDHLLAKAVEEVPADERPMGRAVSKTPGERIPLMAFVAIRAVHIAPGKPRAPADARQKKVDELRSHHPGIKQGSDPRERHRFFYFTDYEELAQELYESGWLEQNQLDGILDEAQKERPLVCTNYDTATGLSAEESWPMGPVGTTTTTSQPSESAHGLPLGAAS
mmetsp:Transcript_10714/g.24415  ORF Transcript_10714/g.24415 Transcript_10714/m.24415 type:complete len:706 (+) Transcript_10714:64-2181(+)